MPPGRNPWPNGARAAVSFTMDNLGEAQAVHTGAHDPATQPVGRDPSVLATLPRILDLLGAAGVRATYFAEAWSLAAYPAAAAELRRRGHELAWHGWQHEEWRGLGSAAAERAVLARSWDAARRALGVGGDGAAAAPYEGFRPPGGDLGPEAARALALFAGHGLRYVSPLGALGVDAATGLAVLPFEWETADAFWYMDKFAAHRRARGRPAAAPGPAAFRAHLLARLEALKGEGGYVAVLFHPFLQTGEERLAVLADVLDRIGGDDDIWVAPCSEVATWVREHAEAFGFAGGT